MKTHRVLVVDDDFISRRFLCMCLEKSGYDVDMAESGIEAKQILTASAPYSCVLTDFQMPELNGLELLKWVQSFDKTLAAVLITAEGDRAIVEQTLRQGACGFLNKPPGRQELEHEVGRAVEATLAHRRMQKIAAGAARVGEAQRALLGSSVARSSLHTEVFHHPHSDAGGDFLFHHQMDEDRHIVLLADVSGHDLKSAYLASYFQGMVRGMLEKGSSLEEVLGRCNRLLIEEWSQGLPLSIALSALRLDLQANLISVCNRGGPRPVLVDEEGRVRELGEAGAPLGWMEEEANAFATCDFSPGSTVRLWTDGVEDLSESLGVPASAVAFGMECAPRGPSKPAWLSEAGDDLMVLKLSARNGADREWRPVFTAKYAPHEAGRIDEWQQQWSRLFSFLAPGITEDGKVPALLCLREGVLNAVRHGCKAGEFASLTLCYRPGQELIRMRIEDPGPGHRFDIERHEADASAQMLEQHRGLLMIRHLASTCRSERNGATLIMDCHLRD